MNMTRDEMTNRNTAFGTWAELLAACKKGYVPTIRSDGSVDNACLRDWLRAEGLRVFDGKTVR